MNQKLEFAKGNLWLIKFAPFRTNWEDVVRRGGFTLRGVRSPGARKHLSAMKKGDIVLFYRSQTDQAVVGVLEVVREAYPDPTSADPRWLTCDFAPVHTLPHAVSLAEIKGDSRLNQLPLLRQPRLSVMPVSRAAFEVIMAISRLGACAGDDVEEP